MFWTAYLLEITLAYNLGRPPSIDNDCITANLPDLEGEVSFAVHHIKHRRIQNKIIKSVYSTGPEAQTSNHDMGQIIGMLQNELDEWRLNLQGSLEHERAPYPYRYLTYSFRLTYRSLLTTEKLLGEAVLRDHVRPP